MQTQSKLNPFVVEGDVAFIGLTDRTGAIVHEVVIDAADLARVQAAGWWTPWRERNSVAPRSNALRLRMGRFLVGDQVSGKVRHRNGDALDNRRCNLSGGRGGVITQTPRRTQDWVNPPGSELIDPSVPYWMTERGRQVAAASRKTRVAKRRQWLRNIMATMSCKRCGQHAEPGSPLHWHHRDPTTKKFPVGRGAYTIPIPDVLDEMAKCDVLCAECHRQTHKEMGRCAVS